MANSWVLLLIGLLGVNFISIGQRIGFFPASTIFQQETTPFYSAVHTPDYDCIQMGGGFSTGPFKSLRNMYVGGAKRLAINANAKQAIGGVVLREARGELLSETGIKGFYNININLLKDVKVGLGTHIGVYQMDLQASNTTSGGNDMGLNIDLSAIFIYKKYSLSSYIQNVNEPSLTLISSQIKYRRNWGMIFQGELINSAIWKSRVSINTSEIMGQWHLVSSFYQVYQETLALGMNVGNKTFALYGGIHQFDINNLNVKMLFGYMLPVGDNRNSFFRPMQVHVTIW